ncbi:MAG: hypothetical protein H0X51_06805 [Parachlamydiaceae bacterium]|nr:hypothetical protein [Parachlamydiaceae bacterium]
MFDNIPKSRALLYLVLAGLLPIVAALLFFFSAQSDIDKIQSTLSDMQEGALLKEKKQAINLAVRNHYRDADHFYIDKYLETLTFLEPEIESLQKLLTNKNLADDEAIKKRLEYLNGPSNSLVFSEGVVQSTPIYQETTETLVHPVEINGNDLQKILARIEGIDVGSNTPSPERPQLMILDLKLDRKAHSEKNEVFILNLKLLKREYL